MFFLPTGEHEAAHADAQDPRHAAALVQRLEAAAAATLPAAVAGARDLEEPDVRRGLELAATAAAAAAATAAADAADLDGAGHRGETIAAGGGAASAKETSQ